MATPRLVFAHYFGGSARSWDPLLAAFDGSMQACAPSLAGFGGEAAPGASTLDDYAQAFAALGGETPWIAVGHSMGAKIALAAAALRPSALKGLILIAPSPPFPQPMSEEDRRASIGAFGDHAAARAQFHKIAPNGLPPAIFKRCVEDEVSVARSAWMWWLERGSRDDISAAAAHVDTPTLVITGDKDVVMGLDTPRRVADALPRAVLHIVPGGGHLLPQEQPQAVVDLIRAFIAGLPGLKESG